MNRDLTTELFILPDGRILVHNLTPAFAELLNRLNPADVQIQPRIQSSRHAARSQAQPAQTASTPNTP